MVTNIFLFISALVAYFVKGITGFGNTLVMASLFSFVVSNKITTPVDLIISIPTNSYMVWRNRKDISLKTVIPLSIMLLLGVIPGTFLLKTGEDWILKAILGVIVAGMGIEMLTRKDVKTEEQKNNKILLFIIGVVSGILAGAYGISALLVAYISRTTDNKGSFRANLCCVFLVDNIFRLVYYSAVGILTLEVIKFSLLISPAVIIGMYIGVKVDNHLNEKVVKKSIIALLIVSGLVLLIKSLLYK